MMPGESRRGGSAPRPLVVAGAFVVLLVVLVVAHYFVVGSESSPPTLSVRSVDAASAPVSACIDRCEQLVSMGVDVSGSLCIVEDLNGYGCAISSNKNSPCSTAESEPQILLDASCNLIGVIG